MKIDPNDPRLTAYALGELDDAERAEIEALLKDDEAARREIETIRRAATVVTSELQSEPCPRLSPEQLAAIKNRFATREEEVRTFPWWRVLGWATALGTAAVVAAMMLPALNHTRERPHRLLPQEAKLEPQTPDSSVGRETASPPAPLPQSAQPLQLSSQLATPPELGRESPRRAVAPQAKPVDLMGWQNDGTHAYNNLQMPPPAAVAGRELAMNTDKVKAIELRQRPPETLAGSGSGQELDVVAGQRNRSYQSNGSQRPEGLTIYRGVDATTAVPHNEADTTQLGSGKAFYNDGHIYRMRQFPTPAEPPPPMPPYGESYTHSAENSFVAVTQNPLSTFSLDVDTASYANIRRFLNQGTLPPRDAVRIEEMLNYFPYDYPAPRRGDPFSLYVEMAECPWNSAHRLALIALKAKDVAPRKVQPMNLVFLIDVSGSMADENKLPLVKQSLRLLVEQLTARDRVAIVVYAGDSRVALPSTPGDEKEVILEVIDSLEASGSTNGGAGIQSAYQEATGHFMEGGVNRVILCTDGDFNVGITDQNQLVRLIQQQAKSGVFLSIFGVGMGNLKDSTMQRLADKGNGNYAYIDNLDEAHKALVEQMRGTLVTVAKDAKVQIEFNPALVQAYRLIGYEKRMLRAQDFNNDRKDAGEVGAGHTVTALYEIVPTGAPAVPGVDALKYQPRSERGDFTDELMTVKLRYKEPDASTSKLLAASVKDQHRSWLGTSSDFRFAASVATFGLILRDSPYKGAANLDLVLHLAEGARGRDPSGYRSEFISLVNQARSLRGNIVPDDP
jgi:Ca-activated chloride channel family protein